MTDGTPFNGTQYHESEQSLDSQLRGAADDLLFHVPAQPPGDFKPSRRPSTTLAGLAVLILAGGAMWGVSRQVQSQPVEVATVNETESTVDGATSGPDSRPLPQVLTEANLGTEPVGRSDLANPAVGEFMTDPAFGSTIVRLTDVAAGEAIVPITTSPSAWNVDETFLLVYRTGGERSGHELYRFSEAGAIELQAELDVQAADIEQVYWSRTDAEVLYYVDGFRLISYNVVDETSTVVNSFDGCDRVDSGTAPVPQSADDNRWGLRCMSDGTTELLAYNVQTGVVRRTSADEAIQAPYPVEAGGGYLIERGDSVDLVDADLNVVRTIPNLEPENVASVVLVDGVELAVGPVYNQDVVGSAVAMPLTDPGPEATTIVGPVSGYPYPPAGTHRGGTGQLDQPSLALAIDGTRLEGGDAVDETLLDGEVVAIDVATSGVTRLAHHRASSDSAFSGPIVSMSPSGRYIVFASDWGGDAVNVYLLYRP